MVTQDDWARRFARAARLIEARLDEPPSLDELARAAAISPFHFHRAWRALTGESVAQSVLRLRLEAGRELLRGSSVTDTALAVGFATPQSFARAFRRQFAMRPSDVHKSQPDAVAGRFTVAIEQRERTVVVALRHLGEYRDLNATFGAVWAHAQQAGVIDSLRGIYGILHDDPASFPPAQLRYDACLALDLREVAAPLALVELPAGPAACLRHTGGHDELEAKTQWLCGDWLLGSGFEPADFPVFQQFLNDPDHTPPAQLETDILLMLTGRGGVA